MILGRTKNIGKRKADTDSPSMVMLHWILNNFFPDNWAVHEACQEHDAGTGDDWEGLHAGLHGHRDKVNEYWVHHTHIYHP